MSANRAAEEAGPAVEDVVSALARVVARMAVARSVSQGAASFRQIAVAELKIATDAEAAVIEQWLTNQSREHSS